LPPDEKQPKASRPILGCPNPIVGTPQWWGYRVFLPSCVVQRDISNEQVATIILGAIVAVLPVSGPPLGITVAVLQLDAKTLQDLDNACGHHGVYTNQTWAGVWWNSKVC
jgi:hypothetical protein